MYILGDVSPAVNQADVTAARLGVDLSVPLSPRQTAALNAAQYEALGYTLLKPAYLPADATQAQIDAENENLLELAASDPLVQAHLHLTQTIDAENNPTPQPEHDLDAWGAAHTGGSPRYSMQGGRVVDSYLQTYEMLYKSLQLPYRHDYFLDDPGLVASVQIARDARAKDQAYADAHGGFSSPGYGGLGDGGPNAMPLFQTPDGSFVDATGQPATSGGTATSEAEIDDALAHPPANSIAGGASAAPAPANLETAIAQSSSPSSAGMEPTDVAAGSPLVDVLPSSGASSIAVPSSGGSGIPWKPILAAVAAVGAVALVANNKPRRRR